MKKILLMLSGILSVAATFAGTTNIYVKNKTSDAVIVYGSTLLPYALEKKVMPGKQEKMTTLERGILVGRDMDAHIDLKLAGYPDKIKITAHLAHQQHILTYTLDKLSTKKGAKLMHKYGPYTVTVKKKFYLGSIWHDILVTVTR